MRTPSGAFATIVNIYRLRGEADVEYPNGEEVCFQLCHLKPMPGKE